MQFFLWNYQSTLTRFAQPVGHSVSFLCQKRLGAAFFAIVNAFFLTRGLQHYEAFFMITTVEGELCLVGAVFGAKEWP